MDLDALKIDRTGTAKSKRRRRGGWGGLVFLALFLGLLFLFRAPLLHLVDRVRLVEVRVQRVARASAAASAAVSGTAANGYVVARTRAALSADTPGRIVSIEVTEGSVLKQGDVVARLFADEYEASLRAAQAELDAVAAAAARAEADLAVARAQVQQAEQQVVSSEAARDQTDAGLRLARLNHERARGLLQENIDTQQRLDEAQAELERATGAQAAAVSQVAIARGAVDVARSQLSASEAALAEVRARVPLLEARRDLAAATLDKTIVRAPFDGVVVLKDAEVGEVVSPNSQGAQSRGSVATMVDLDSLEVQVELPETSLESVRAGGPASIFLDAFPGEGYDGRVLRIWPTANRQKGTVEVRVGFDAPDGRLRPEMGARVVFLAEEAGPPEERSDEPAPGSLMVPMSALVREGGRSAVFVLERDTVVLRAVELGVERSSRVQVTEGLEEGEQIVLEPPPSLGDGDRVLVQGS